LRPQWRQAKQSGAKREALLIASAACQSGEDLLSGIPDGATATNAAQRGTGAATISRP